MPHPYLPLRSLLCSLDTPTLRACLRLLDDHKDVLAVAKGSTSNHQAWPGGYLDHVTETMNVAVVLYRTLSECRALPFQLSDALLVLFFHDIEKPWRMDVDPVTGASFVNPGLQTKKLRRLFREAVLKQYGIQMTPDQQNALRYVEGEGDDYSSEQRVMGPLAAFCHMCDVASARLWFDMPAPNDSTWGPLRTP